MFPNLKQYAQKVTQSRDVVDKKNESSVSDCEGADTAPSSSEALVANKNRLLQQPRSMPILQHYSDGTPKRKHGIRRLFSSMLVASPVVDESDNNDPQRKKCVSWRGSRKAYRHGSSNSSTKKKNKQKEGKAINMIGSMTTTDNSSIFNSITSGIFSSTFAHHATTTIPSPCADSAAPTGVDLNDEKPRSCQMAPVVDDESSSFIISSEHFLLPTEDPSSCKLTKNVNEELGYLRIPYVCRDAALFAVRETKRPLVTIQAERPVHVLDVQKVFLHPLVIEALETLCILLLEAPDWEKGSLAPTKRVRITFQVLHTVTGSDSINNSCTVSVLQGNSLTTQSIISAIIESAKQSKVNMNSWLVPRYLQILQDEEIEGRNTAFFVILYPIVCEVAMAAVEGVLATRVATRVVDDKKQHVLEVVYDSHQVSFCTLIRHMFASMLVTTIFYQSNEERLAAQVEVTRHPGIKCTLSADLPSLDDYQFLESKHALRQTPLKSIPMTPLQSTRANRLVQTGKFNEAANLLSPRQGMLLMNALRQNSWRTVIDMPILAAWLYIDGNNTIAKTDDTTTTKTMLKQPLRPSDSSSIDQSAVDIEYQSYEYERMSVKPHYFRN